MLKTYRVRVSDSVKVSYWTGPRKLHMSHYFASPFTAPTA